MLQVLRGWLASSSISTPSRQSGARRLPPPPPTFLRMIERSRRSPRSRNHSNVSDWGPTSDDELSIVLTSGQHTVTTSHYVPLRSKVSNIRLLRPLLRFLLLPFPLEGISKGDITKTESFVNDILIFGLLDDVTHDDFLVKR
jgi:hypothetical protein